MHRAENTHTIIGLLYTGIIENLAQHSAKIHSPIQTTAVSTYR